MGYLFYDRDSGIGYYMSDKEFKDGCGILACGVGLLALYGFILCALAAVVVTPLLMIVFVDDFFETIVVNNLLVFFVLTIALIICKCIPKLANISFVRILFDVYVVAFVLFIFFYVLKFDGVFYSVIRLFGNLYSEDSNIYFLEIFGKEFFEITNGHWFYDFLNGSTNLVTGWIDFFISKIKNIGNNPLNTAIDKVDILLVLKAIGVYVINGLPLILIVLIGEVLLLVTILLSVIVPYLFALGVMILLNKLFYYVKIRDIANIKTPNDYESK